MIHCGKAVRQTAHIFRRDSHVRWAFDVTTCVSAALNLERDRFDKKKCER